MPPPTALDKWLKKATSDDTGLTRPPVAMRVSAHKDEVRSIVHGYFQSQFRVSVYKVVVRPRQDVIKRQEALTTVTNAFMGQYTIPMDTNELPKLPSRRRRWRRRRWRKNRMQLGTFFPHTLPG